MDKNELLKTLGTPRSPDWASVRKEFLKNNPKCAVCGGTTKMEVHHMKPFHSFPTLELDINNLISLCEAGKNGIVCHLAFGHLGSYKSINKKVVKDSKDWKKKITERP